jgi:hypothetical protein
VSDGYKSRFRIGFANNDRNLQLLIPISVNVTCEGAAECFVPASKPTPPPTPHATSTSFLSATQD